jgi:hypothetical protein
MRVTPLIEKEIPDAKAGKFDFFICRPRATLVDPGAYTAKARLFLEPLAKKRPYYDAISFVKLLFILPLAYRQFKREQSEGITSVSATEPTISFLGLMAKIERDLYYCTEMLRDMLSAALGRDYIRETFGVDYCSPIESEKFSVWDCEFVYGVCNSVESGQLWRETMAWWPK